MSTSLYVVFALAPRIFSLSASVAEFIYILALEVFFMTLHAMSIIFPIALIRVKVKSFGFHVILLNFR